MGGLFLYSRTRTKTKLDAFAKLTVNCPLGVTVRAASADTSVVIDVVSNNGVAVFNRLSEGSWNITFADVEYAPIKQVKIDSLDNEITIDYFEATINVTYPEGSVCTCSDGNTVLTAPDTSGSCTFTVLNTGEWTVTSVRDDLSDTEIVNITTDEQTVDVILKYFEAYINITYPEESACTLTNGVKTYTAPDTSGNWICVVNYSGIWTVTCSNGERTESSEIVIETDGQNVSTELTYFEATINITYTEGSICTCSCNDEIYRAPDTSGSWECSVKSKGAWIIVVSDNIRSETDTVTITDDGEKVSISVMLFEAYIDVTYPAGSTCICTDGANTLAAPDTSGTWYCDVPNVGTWIVSCTDGSQTDSESVYINSDGQRESVSLSYWNGELYDSGEEFTTHTGGWEISGTGTKDSNYITAGGTGITGTNTAYTAGLIDLTEFNTLNVNIVQAYTGSSNGYGYIRIENSAESTVISNTLFSGITNKSNYTVNLDISSLSGSYRIKIIAYYDEDSTRDCYVKFDKVWCE